jgi:cell division protein FtsB
VPRANRPLPTKTTASRRTVGPTGRSRLVLLGAVVLSAAILIAWFPAGSLFNQRASLASASAELSQLHRQDAALSQERKNLSDSAEITRIAREQYQLVSPGQQAFQVLPPSGAATANVPYTGDPGAESPVAPSASVDLPPGSVTTTTTTATPSSHASTRRDASQHSEGTLSRMLHALEFWR